MSKLNQNRVGFFVLGAFLGSTILGFVGAIFGGALGGAKRG